jgi:hypothetical protein|tara:strand:+ start:16529 stop:16765 length:237 start_codon:yes stop_codon:yes gene_type:complete
MRTIIIYAEQGKGKTSNAERLRAHFGCSQVVDAWAVGEPITRGALMLTNDSAVLAGVPAGAELVHLDAALAELGVRRG